MHWSTVLHDEEVRPMICSVHAMCGISCHHFYRNFLVLGDEHCFGPCVTFFMTDTVTTCVFQLIFVACGAVVGYNSSLQWRHNERDRVSNHQPHDCLLNHLFRRRLKETSKFRVTGLRAGKQRASNAENVSIWWRHHVAIYSHLWDPCTYIIYAYGYLFPVLVT